MAVLSSDLIRQGASGVSTGYTIDQSIRFNDDDTAYMSRTPSGAGNRRTWSWSGWIKRGDLSTYSAGRVLLHHGTSGGLQEVIRIDSAATNQYLMYYSDPDGTAYVRTNVTLNDVSAWYHAVFVKDSTQVVASERVRIYLNGIRQTSLQNSTYPSSSSQGYINNTVLHRIGADQNGSSSNYDGYLAEIHFLDGYAYGPEYFGEFNSSGIWIPKEYEGSYGTNGFYMKGEDSSNLGNDSSGNNNDYSTNGLAAHDQVLDSPTNNFAVINTNYSTRTTSGAGSTHTVENGNLFQQADSYSSSNYGTRPFTVQPLNRGKWYFEFEGNTEAGGGNLVHVVISEESAFYTAQGAQSTNRYGLYLESGSAMYVLYPGSSRQETNAPIAQYTKIIGCAIDFDNAKMYFFVDGAEIHGQDISEGTAASNLSGWSTSSNWIIQFATVTASNNSARSNIIFNFGQEGTFAGTQSAGGNSDGNGIGNFKHSVPSGYLALCTSNLGS